MSLATQSTFHIDCVSIRNKFSKEDIQIIAMLHDEFKNARIEDRKLLFRNAYTLWVDSLHMSPGAALTQDGEKVRYHHLLVSCLLTHR